MAGLALVSSYVYTRRRDFGVRAWELACGETASKRREPHDQAERLWRTFLLDYYRPAGRAPRPMSESVDGGAYGKCDARIRSQPCFFAVLSRRLRR
jgi:hypothetical protein